MSLFTPEEIARNQALNERDRNYNRDNGLSGSPQPNNIPAPPPPSAPSNSGSSSGGPYGMNTPPSIPSGSSGGGYTFDPNHVYNPSSPVPHPGMATPPIATPGGLGGPAVPYPGMATPGSASSGGYSPPVPTPPQGQQQNNNVIKDASGRVIGVIVNGQYQPINQQIPAPPPGGGLSFDQGLNGRGPQGPMLTGPQVPAPPPRDMNAINQYAESQVGARLDAAGRARDLATGNLNTQAGQLTTQLNTQAEQQRTRLAATREQALKGLSTGYGQAQQGITDQRNLQNVDLQRQGRNPSYSGADAYQQAMLARERELTDKQNSQIYNNQIGSLEQDYQNNITGIEQDISNRTAKIQQDLQMNQANIQKAWQDVANAAPAEKERLIQIATKEERDYQLALRNADRDDVLLQLQAAKTQMEQTRLNQDVLNQNRSYDLNLNDQKYNQQYKTDTLTEQKKQNNIDNAAKLGQQYGVGVLPKESGQSLFEQVAGLPTVQAQQLAQETERFGLEYALKKAIADHSISQDAADLVLKQAQTNIAQQNANTASQRQQQQGQPGQPKQGDFTKYITELNGRFTTKDADGNITNMSPYQQRQTIIGLGLDDQTTIQLLNFYGLPIQPTSNSGGR